MSGLTGFDPSLWPYDNTASPMWNWSSFTHLSLSHGPFLLCVIGQDEIESGEVELACLHNYPTNPGEPVVKSLWASGNRNESDLASGPMTGPARPSAAFREWPRVSTESNLAFDLGYLGDLPHEYSTGGVKESIPLACQLKHLEPCTVKDLPSAECVCVCLWSVKPPRMLSVVERRRHCLVFPADAILLSSFAHSWQPARSVAVDDGNLAPSLCSSSVLKVQQTCLSVSGLWQVA